MQTNTFFIMLIGFIRMLIGFIRIRRSANIGGLDYNRGIAGCAFSSSSYPVILCSKFLTTMWAFEDKTHCRFSLLAQKKSVSFRDVLRFATTYRKHEKRRAPPCASYEVRRSQFQYITKHNSSSKSHWLCQKRNANYLCWKLLG